MGQPIQNVDGEPLIVDLRKSADSVTEQLGRTSPIYQIWKLDHATGLYVRGIEHLELEQYRQAARALVGGLAAVSDVTLESEDIDRLVTKIEAALPRALQLLERQKQIRREEKQRLKESVRMTIQRFYREKTSLDPAVQQDLMLQMQEGHLDAKTHFVEAYI